MSDRARTANDGAAESRLHEAAWCGELAEVTRLVEGGAEVNWRDSIGETALFGAGADSTMADHQGRLPVDVAHKYGKGAHVSYLKSIGPPIASRRNEDKA